MRGLVAGGQILVLGPVALVDGAGPVTPPAMLQRLVTGLVLADGRVCRPDELLDVLWGESPPPSARKLIRVYVSQLRKALPGGLEIETVGGGYALRLPAGALDAQRFEQLLADCQSARRDGDNAALAASLAGQALALWRGRAFGELAYDEVAQAESERLEELRLVAREERLDAQLALGRHDDTVGEALALADEHPFRERAHELAVVALYRCGRQADALEHYAAFRARLDDELGLEPGSGLRELQRHILQQDPRLEANTTVDTAHAVGALPEPPNRLIGRDAELRSIAALLDSREVRLLVLTGAGGSGKTRLALEVARAAAPSYANGAVLVELAPLSDPELVVPTIAQALGVPDASEPLDALAEALRSRELLLVLDNAEHVREATPAVVELLSRAPRLTVLVTSRAVLHLTGEHVLPVAPLDAEAAQILFEQRARSLQPAFRITSETRGAVEELCRRVDGLPLAVELAAARVRALSPQTVLDRLNERLSFLAGGPRDLPARQQTLHETLDWSYDLLGEDERTLLARLSVFRGGATLAAVAQICLGGDESRAFDFVERLSDASLVLVRQADGEVRYDLLETVRQYAAERLESLDSDGTRLRHAEWFLSLAERAEPELSGERQAHWFAVLEAEHDNARAALACLTGVGLHDRALRLTVSLSRFWYVRGHLTEGRHHLEVVLPSADGEDPLLMRRAQTAGASIALLQGDYAAATAYAERALESARRAGEPRFVANALSNLGAIVLADGDTDRAAHVLEHAVALAREGGDRRITALALNNLGDLALTTGDYARARPLFEESHSLLEELGDKANLARSLFNRGAVDLMLEAHAAAGARFREGLALARETDDKEDLAWCLEGLAALAAAERNGELAATLLGVADALLAKMGADFKPFERRLHETTEARATALCGPVAYAEANELGASLTLNAAVGLALGRDVGPP